MRIDIATLFPQMVDTVIDESIIGRARKSGAIKIYCHNIRDYSTDKHRRTDFMPYGGGMGMVMWPQPIYDCYKAVQRESGHKPYVIYMSPQGTVFTQKVAKRLVSGHESLFILCGHYEGVDERLIEEIVDEEISIGDFVMTGGELGALVVCDAVARMVPGVLKDESSFTEESHWDGLLEYPQYTRPFEWKGREVPEILLSGHHANIENWRRKQAIIRTAQKRPDMLKTAQLSDLDKKIIEDLENIDNSCE